MDFIEFIVSRHSPPKIYKKSEREKNIDSKKDPLLKYIGSIEHGSLAKDIDNELYGDIDCGKLESL